MLFSTKQQMLLWHMILSQPETEYIEEALCAAFRRLCARWRSVNLSQTMREFVVAAARG